MDTIFEQDNYMMTFINGFEKGEPEYILAIDIPTKYYKAKFEKDQDDNFVLKFSAQEDFNAEYFFKRPAVLRAPGFIDIILMNSDAISFTQQIAAPYEVKVVYKSFSTELDSTKWSKSKHCAYFKYNKNDFRYTKFCFHYELTTHKNQYSSWKNAFVIKVEPQNDILVSFEETISGDDAYCVFRSQKTMDFVLFEKVVNAVRTIIGLMAGYYFGERVYYLSDYTKDKPKDKTPLIIRYKNTCKAIRHRYPLLDAGHYQDIDKTQLELTPIQLNKLVMLLIENEDYQRALQLLIDASVTDGASRGAIAAVALESIANNLSEKGPASHIISNTEVASQLKHELKKVLKIIKPRVSNEEYNKIESKIGAVNIQPNAVKLEYCFEKMGIQLNEEEAFCISCRNSFLHGGLPKHKDLTFLTQDEMVFMVSHRLIMLTTMLMLKQAGFEGSVIDWGFTEVVKRRAIREGNPILREGNAHRKV